MKQIKTASYLSPNRQHFSNYRTFLGTKGPLNAASEGNPCMFVFFYFFNNYIATIPTPDKNAHYTASTLIHQRLSKFGPLKNLIKAWGIEIFRTENINRCSLFKIQHAPKTSLWTTGLEEKY